MEPCVWAFVTRLLSGQTVTEVINKKEDLKDSVFDERFIESDILVGQDLFLRACRTRWVGKGAR